MGRKAEDFGIDFFDNISAWFKTEIPVNDVYGEDEIKEFVYVKEEN
jgi:hypothetical protein